jgi:beta-glucosidase
MNRCRLHLLQILPITLIIVSLVATIASGQAIYKNPGQPVQKRVRDLMKRMTLDEKLGQLQCEIKEIPPSDSSIERGLGSIATPLRPLGARDAALKANQIQKRAVEGSRLGIPVMIHDEGLHGLIGKGATSFPQAIGLAATWDPDLLHDVATVIGRQTKSRGIGQLLSPVLNIARDVRWGRVEETYGEDPVLTSEMGVAFCRGIEEQGVASTPKHFAANVGDGGRDSHPIHFSERLLREIYFPAFKACFQKAHALSVMAAYNSLDGIPCSSNRWLLTDVLRKEWGFGGFVVSDYGSVGGILDLHHAASTRVETAVQSLKAGMDIELPGRYIFGDSLRDAIARGIVPSGVLDSAVSHVLAAKFRLGLFEHHTVDPDAAERGNDTPSDRALALKAARESIVLLKNDNAVLPLKTSIHSIAVIGPNADAKILGGYSGSGMPVVTVLEGIRSAVGPSVTVRYAKGCEITQSALPAIPGEFLIPTDAKPGEHGIHAEYFNNMTLTGPPSLVRTDNNIHFNWGDGSPDSVVPVDHYSARWSGKLVSPETGAVQFSATSDDGIRVYLDGKLLVDSWVDRAPTSDYFTVRLDSGKTYDLRVEYYENGGGASASLGWSAGRKQDTLMAQAVAAASGADAAVIVTGIIEGEGEDRSDLGLPGEQAELIRRVAATGVPTAVVLMAGSAVTMTPWIDKVPAVLDMWYGGEEGGNALADVLFGKYNPGGKLPATFPLEVGQVPLYYNLKPSGRGYDYVDLSGKPRYAFGHGLSYTTFDYSALAVTPAQIAVHPTAKNKKRQTASEDNNIVVKFTVTNTGLREGDEVSQCYIHATIPGMVRPFKELKKFKRISLKPGEKREVEFVLGKGDLEIPGEDLRPAVLAGNYEVLVGSSSSDIRLKGEFGITEEVTKGVKEH